MLANVSKIVEDFVYRLTVFGHWGTEPLLRHVL